MLRVVFWEPSPYSAGSPWPQAQRGSNNLTVVDPAGGPTMSADDSSRPRATPPTDANPLRTPARPPARSVPPTSGPAARPPAADLFGLQCADAQLAAAVPRWPPTSPPPATTDSIPDAAATGLPARQRAAANASQYSQMATAARADQSVGGPTLISSDSGQPGNDRAATRSGRAANRGSEFQTLPTAAVESQEPASLPVNPFAKPASSTRGAKSDQGGPSTLSPLADSSRAADVALASEGEGTGQPGGKQLEGPQSPQLTIQKFGPEGNPSRQAGRLPRHGPQHGPDSGLRKSRSATWCPRARGCWAPRRRPRRGARGEIVWTLGTIRPGEESTRRDAIDADGRRRDRQRGHGPLRRRRLGPLGRHPAATGRRDHGARARCSSASR